MIKGAIYLKKLLFEEKESHSERLVISPILDWDQQIHPGSASVDIRLGRIFSIPIKPKIPSFDPLNQNFSNLLRNSMDEVFVDFGDNIIIHPRQFVLGCTLEWISLPCNLAAYVIGRSSWGRDGLIIATATGVHPGYSGILTLEITNLGEVPLHLYPGVTIAQLFFHDVDQQGVSKQDVSQFLASTKPEPKDPMGNDRMILEKFKDNKDKKLNRIN